MTKIELLVHELQPIREKVVTHSLYGQIEEIKDVQTFMQYHVFAVWDFMSLLKSLQLHVTTIKTPWIPAKDPEISRFINEIVLGEESDSNEGGKPMSHYEMYIEAMIEIKADTTQIENLLKNLSQGIALKESLRELNVKEEVKDFMRFTFDVIDLQKPHITAAVFTMGREDLIPDLFIGIVKNLEKNSDATLRKLIYYLERHIELDGDEHGPVSLKMLENLCGNDNEKWNEALKYSKIALEERLKLWDSISNTLRKREIILS